MVHSKINVLPYLSFHHLGENCPSYTLSVGQEEDPSKTLLPVHNSKFLAFSLDIERREKQDSS
jgi:hypothetical protein